MARKQAGRKTAARKGAPARRGASKTRGSKARPKARAAKARTTAGKRKAAASRLTRTRTARKAVRRSAPARKPAPKMTKPGPAAARRAAPAAPPAKAPRKKPSSTRARQVPSLERSRRQLPEFEDNVPTPPSSLDLDRSPSAARSGRQGALVARSQHNETSPELTGGDVDADWEDAYAVGDEAPGGDNPTPDQDRVDDIGRALGVEYQDNEELKASEKITKRDKHRWELDPASAEDYNDRDVE
jgi:Family of unknown function (DUF6335)